MRTGSDAYPGAAVLGVEAAWRAGVGMVRYLGPARPSQLVLARRPETVTADGRVQAWVIGSGTDAATRGPAETEALRAILAGTDPVVVDAGALDLAAEATAPRVLTPHEREHARLRRALGLPPAGEDRVRAALETAEATGAVVLLKGSATVVAAPGGWSTIVESGTPWLATAGTGDVLAGLLGARLAGGVAPLAAAEAAVWLHGRAAQLAGPAFAADDLIPCLPRAIAECLR